jgi:Glycosyl transferases group 1
MEQSVMRIMHICLASAYTEGLTYQDNIIPDCNRLDDHDVLVVSGCEKFVNAQITPCEPEDRILANGIRLVRLPFKKIVNCYLSSKLRNTPELMALIKEFKPHSILYHGVIGWELRTLGRYKKIDPNVLIFIDSHEDFHNSGRTWISRNVQHKLITRLLLTQTLKVVEKILYVSTEARDFLEKMLRIPDNKLEFFPLGGLVIDENEKRDRRKRARMRLGFKETDLVLLHTGKLDPLKRTTVLLQAMSQTTAKDINLLLAGDIPATQSDVLVPLIEQDKRVRFLGWQNQEQLTDLMSAADVYIQPGSQSATLQVAICCGMPIMVFPYKSHLSYVAENGFFVESVEDIRSAIETFYKDRARIRLMEKNSFVLARKLLDYRKLSRRIYTSH